MPNWCANTLRFHGEEAELIKLHDIFQDAASKEYVKTDFKEPWLGNFLYAVGLGDKAVDKYGGYNCRGYITDISDVRVFSGDSKTFDVNAETAWSYDIDMWDAIIEASGLKSIKYSLYAEELTEGFLVIYDPYNLNDFDDEYQISYLIEKDDTTEEETNYGTEADLVNLLQKLLESDLTTIEELSEYCSEENGFSEDSYVDFIKVERITELTPKQK